MKEYCQLTVEQASLYQSIVDDMMEKIDQMIEDKKALADLVVGDGEGWLTELSSGDLRKVFALSDGAIGE